MGSIMPVSITTLRCGTTLKAIMSYPCLGDKIPLSNLTQDTRISHHFGGFHFQPNPPPTDMLHPAHSKEGWTM